MIPENVRALLENDEYLQDNQFEILAELSRQLFNNRNQGRDLLIRLLEKRKFFTNYEEMLSDLIEQAGLFPYLKNISKLSISEQLAYEFHRPLGLNDIVLHSAQLEVYHRLLAGENVILSAPTSFGKSLLIDAMIATRKYDNIVIIVPTIALIDETRRRLFARFSKIYKIITHPNQQINKKVIYVLTQERFLEFESGFCPNFFVIDEFYKLNPIDGYDERTISLNSAFGKLYNSRAQFLMIGPNIQDVQSGSSPIRYSFIRTDFSTVATDIIRVPVPDGIDAACIGICKKLKEPTLIFCKSANSAYDLAQLMIEGDIIHADVEANAIADWLRDNYHPDWDLVKLLRHGIAIHHGNLPRSIAHYILQLFNDGHLKFLLCTSTIIEGVNTSAKNIIIYDNKIARDKFDFFTFNNIKGRAGRMLKHFIGRVYLLNDAPAEGLPLVDIPILSAPEDIPITLSFDVPPTHELSDFTKEQLKYLHAQDYLAVDIIRAHPSILPERQISLAKEISENPAGYSNELAWKTFPNADQLKTVCHLIFDILMDKKGVEGVFSADQLNFKIRNLQYSIDNGIRNIILNELSNTKYCHGPTEAVEKTLSFLRRWGEYNFPKYLSAVNDIQKYVLERAGFPAGDYNAFSQEVKQWFLPPSATLLEEYGIPFQIALKIEEQFPLGDNIDDIVENLKNVDFTKISLSHVEENILKDALADL